MIELTVAGSNAPALVDDCWAHLKRYRWRLDRDGYVMRKANGRRIYLHQVVMPGDRYPAYLRDHISRDKFDNRSTNLRWLTQAESVQNRSVCSKNRTGFRGVRFDTAKQQYLARIQKDGRSVVRQWFDTAEAANAFLQPIRMRLLPASIQ